MNLDQLTEYAPHALIVIGLIVAASGSIRLPKIGSLFAKKELSRPQVVALLDQVYSHFEAEGCEEGKASVRECVKHVYLEHPHG